MKLLFGSVALALALVALSPGCAAETANTAASQLDPEVDVETRIVRYLEENLRPGQPVVVSDLLNDVFQTPEEQEALSRMYNTFFKIPLFLVQFEASSGNPPTLEEIAEQFNFTIPGQVDVMLRVMESDPRIPPFFERDPNNGEITSVDVDPIRNHPQFGQEIERSLAGWEGRSLPEFTMETFDGEQITSADVEGRPHLIYVWFSNCPPCVQTSPLLVELYNRYEDSGFEIIAANADRYLELPYSDEIRSEYVSELGIRFVTCHLTEQVQNSLGGISVFPTMFFVNREGVVTRQFVNFQEVDVLEDAIRSIL